MHHGFPLFILILGLQCASADFKYQQTILIDGNWTAATRIDTGGSMTLLAPPPIENDLANNDASPEIIRINPLGGVEWKRIFSNMALGATKVDAGWHGEVYAAGTTALFNSSIALMKIDGYNNEQWLRSKSFLFTNHTIQVAFINIDPAGSCWVTTQRTDGEGYFLTRFNTQGIELWTRSYAEGQNIQLIESATDKALNYVLAGRIVDETGTSQTFLTKLDQNGQLVWTTQKEELKLFVNTTKLRLEVDSVGNIAVAVPRPDNGTHESSIFIIKMDVNASEIWSVEVGTKGTDTLYDILVDSNDHIVVVGLTDVAKNKVIVDIPPYIDVILWQLNSDNGDIISIAYVRDPYNELEGVYNAAMDTNRDAVWVIGMRRPKIYSVDSQEDEPAKTFLMEFTYADPELPLDMVKTIYHIFISLFAVGLVVVGILTTV